MRLTAASIPIASRRCSGQRAPRRSAGASSAFLHLDWLRLGVCSLPAQSNSPSIIGPTGREIPIQSQADSLRYETEVRMAWKTFYIPPGCRGILAGPRRILIRWNLYDSIYKLPRLGLTPSEVTASVFRLLIVLELHELPALLPASA
ncbi:hypothetical protein BDV09DRAFT_44537 [Aspergillus tetrazonus]